MAARRVLGKAWGNALGGYKFQKRGPGGRFGSGFVGSVSSKSVLAHTTPGQRRAQYLRKEAKSAKRKATAKKAAKIAGATAAVAGAGYIGYKAYNGQGPLGNQGKNIARIHRANNVARIRKKNTIVASKVNNPSVVRRLDHGLSIAAATAGTAASLQASVNQLKRGVNQNQNKQYYIDPNTGVARTLADNGVPNNRQMASSLGIMETQHSLPTGHGSVSNSAPSQNLHQDVHIPAGHVHKMDADAHDSKPFYYPQKGPDGVYRMARSNGPSHRGVAGEKTKYMNSEVDKDSDYAGKDMLEEISNPKSKLHQPNFFEQSFAADDLLGSGNSKLPQARAKKNLKVVGLDTAVDRSSKGYGGILQGTPHLDFAGNPINPDREAVKAARRNRGMKDEELKRALDAYQDAYGRIDPETGESQGPLGNIADLLDMKAENPGMMREDFVMKSLIKDTTEIPGIEYDQSAGLGIISGETRSSYRKSKYRQKDDVGFAPYRSGDEAMYSKGEQRGSGEWTFKKNQGKKKDGTRDKVYNPTPMDNRDTRGIDPFLQAFWTQQTGIPESDDGPFMSTHQQASGYTVPNGLEVVPVGIGTEARQTIANLQEQPINPWDISSAGGRGKVGNRHNKGRGMKTSSAGAGFHDRTVVTGQVPRTKAQRKKKKEKLRTTHKYYPSGQGYNRSAVVQDKNGVWKIRT